MNPVNTQFKRENERRSVRTQNLIGLSVLGAGLIALGGLGLYRGCNGYLEGQAQRRAELQAQEERYQEPEMEDPYSPEAMQRERDNFSKEQIRIFEEGWKNYENGTNSSGVHLDSQLIQKVIDYYSHGKSKITAEDIVRSSRRTKVPEIMYLVSLAQEGNFATRGRAVRTNNPGNVGNTDNGANRYLNSLEEGLDLYGKKIAQDYFPNGKPNLGEFIARDFRRPSDSARYMSNPHSIKEYQRIFKKIVEMSKS